MKFLSAHWKHLLLANYSIDPDVLLPFVPRSTTLDEFDGHTYVSLVAFLFDRTKLMGVPIPFHRRFEEVNLRFYVKPDKDPSMRAVTFIKEIVPKPIISLVANYGFSEKYAALPMAHENGEDRHWYSWENGRTNRFEATITEELSLPAANSVGEFITEHYWGYSKGKARTTEYEVEHPQWPCCEVADYTIDVDFGRTYGDRFAFLNERQPVNVLYAEGLGGNGLVSPKTVAPLSRW